MVYNLKVGEDDIYISGIRDLLKYNIVDVRFNALCTIHYSAFSFLFFFASFFNKIYALSRYSIYGIYTPKHDSNMTE